MSRIRSELGLAIASLALALTLPPAIEVAAQEATALPQARIVSHEVSLSNHAATLRLELADGRTVDLAVLEGQVRLNGDAVGAAPRGSELDRSWRDLLTQVMDANTDALPSLLRDWTPSNGGDVGGALDRALEDAVAGVGTTLVTADAVPLTDSMVRLQERIAELEAEKAAMAEARAEARERRGRGPLHYISHGFAHVMSTLIVFAVLMGLGLGIVFFGGRKYIEGVADTARHQTTRSFLVGIAGTFLIMPAFVLGIIALVISIVGILAVPVWVIGFPLALFGALVLGYLGIAHAAGEALAERRFYVNDWFQRGNSYYFIATGLGLLLALFIAGGVIGMAGPWLNFLSNLLTFFAVVTTWAAFTIGFGAVLISRGGKRPRGMEPAPESDLFTEEAGVS